MSNTFTVQRTTWMSWFSPLHCVELQDISRSHLVASLHPLTQCEDPWNKVSHTKQQVHNKGAGAGWGYEQQETSPKCVKSQVNVCWRESHIKDNHSFRLMGTNGKPHTPTHIRSEAQMAMCGPCVDVIYSIRRQMSKIPHLQPEDCSLTKIS